MVACRCEISLLVLKIFHSFAALTREAFFSTLEEKFLVAARPCNILYLLGIYKAQLDNLVLKYINLELRRRFPCAKGKGEVGFRQVKSRPTKRAERKRKERGGTFYLFSHLQSLDRLVSFGNKRLLVHINYGAWYCNNKQTLANPN